MKIMCIFDNMLVDLFLLRCIHSTVSHECSVFACGVFWIQGGGGKCACVNSRL
ncbi:hypothetical protein GQ55_7G019700 [Panicum hallii var. hallii]|uniref:Uncharacterized protein n=1 Tax=Panicum hallii var. hallii TaxID=1504633 RepID=A0A2T7CRY7_9POAL|nr:hypothetical protein GQ55_7G019700 [Panicum hallii var. hallii]